MAKRRIHNPKSKNGGRTSAQTHAYEEPSYVLSLSFKNVRCFGPVLQEVDLSDGQGRPAHWTVIVGDNGTGKSTVLECIAGLANDAHYPLTANVDVRMTVPRFVPMFLRREDDLRRIGSRGSVEIKSDIRHGARLMELRKKTRVESFAVSIAILTPGGGRKFAWSETDPTINPFCYGAGRRIGSAQLAEKRDRDLEYPFDERDLTNAEEWLLQFDYSWSKAKGKTKDAIARRRKQVRDLLIEVLPDVEAVRFTTPTKTKSRPGVEFKTPDGWVRLRGISYGYRTMVAWMVDLSARMVDRYPDSEDPLSEPAVVLVDEIDLHLHPRWQRDLMSFLSERFPNTQFIVTAHSPLFVQAARDANLVVLKRSKKKGYVEILNDVEAVRGWRIDQIVTSDLFGLSSARPPETEKLLDERRKILTKSRLTKKDKVRLAELEEQIGVLPVGEGATDAETMRLLRETLSTLKARESSRERSEKGKGGKRVAKRKARRA